MPSLDIMVMDNTYEPVSLNRDQLTHLYCTKTLPNKGTLPDSILLSVYEKYDGECPDEKYFFGDVILTYSREALEHSYQQTIEDHLVTHKRYLKLLRKMQRAAHLDMSS